MSYDSGSRAATNLRTNVLDSLRSEGVARSNIDVFIHVYTKAESPNTLITPSSMELLADFRRGFNASDPRSTYEDPIDSGPSGAGGKSPCSPSTTIIAQSLTTWHNRPTLEESQS